MPDSSLFLDYDLPRELIAQEPLRNRADARLMVLHRETGRIDHRHVRDLPELLRSGDRMVVNDTRVLPAQLVGARKATGGRWQGLYLGSEPSGEWRIVCKTRGRLQPGDAIELEDRDGRPTHRIWMLERQDGGQWIAKLDPDEPVLDALAKIGRVPIPHYIRGGRAVDADARSYQTVFARRPGAVAAPTAGLHLTEPLMRLLTKHGVSFSAVTLHVGLGTFRPIASAGVEAHVMHSETGELNEKAVAEITATRAAAGRVIAVGTTSVRVLETAALRSGEEVQPWSGETDLYIRPPHSFAMVDALMTNFHFPRTTLLLMVQALSGSELLRRAYHEAIEQRYRFYSYGDAMLIL
ncbi:S-adenosylmethionine:tRNA ribosyltransferase-isomerase [Pirellulimonas nuda]|uniref:S-adenosylmethionine:tRNA ribosyltransferase-isomerase n=1 Tax=Pirellulimonas nuda TaxID=2528009 RepID=A0A518DF67_9BACT|nr:tRNA preQ1(34) S-adenosylmethionine ribosyltransferase-isomerase QueA [Pirellulimonas nuda]QDU90098.1 S-adenosylmethionine:tRNA ribosyltransferase-isomerase [Pirellulimonas nuda]